MKAFALMMSMNPAHVGTSARPSAVADTIRVTTPRAASARPTAMRARGSKRVMRRTFTSASSVGTRALKAKTREYWKGESPRDSCST